MPMRTVSVRRDRRPPSAAEVTKDREHPPMVRAVAVQVELAEDAGDVAFDRRELHVKAVGDRTVGAALGHEAKDLLLTMGEAVEWIAAAAKASELGEDQGVDRHASQAH